MIKEKLKNKKLSILTILFFNLNSQEEGEGL